LQSIELTEKIIGGMFGLEDPLNVPAGPALPSTDRSLFLVNARSGIRLLIEILAPSAVWLPSYLCACIIEAAHLAKTQVRFYELDDRLALISREWLNDVQQGDLVLVIDFFGVGPDAELMRSAQECGAWVVEDACQALLTRGVGATADFVLMSPRKFLGIPDGGILTFKLHNEFESVSLQQPPSQWWLKAWFATILRREFDLHGTDHRWFELFQETEAQAPVGPYAMSQLSRLLLQNGFSYDRIAERRVANYRILAEALGASALFPSLPAGVVPLGFPIRVRDRDALRQSLFKQKIYPPVHWTLEGFVPAEFGPSHLLAAEIMTLPCDQRYDEADMKRMAQVVLEGIRL
jgi:dTDP-4-amino-4,6-dideoxygalactose transaminase